MTVLPAGPLTQKALHEARQVALEQCRELGRRLRYDAHPKPAEDDPRLDLMGDRSFYEAVLAGWNQMDERVRASDLSREGRRLFLDGQPIPGFPGGAATFDAALAELKAISARRAGWLKAQEAAKQDQRRAHIIDRALAPDTDVRGHTMPTPERAEKGGLRREIVEGDAKEEVRTYRDRQPTQLHRFQAKYADDITPEHLRAGLRLRREWAAAGHIQRTVGAYSPLSGAGQGEMSDRRTAAWETMQMLMARCWRGQLRVVKEETIKLVIEDYAHARVSLVKVGLEQLVRYYEHRDKAGADE